VREIALSGVIGALSYALDITEGQPAGHAVRSCMIGMRIAEELELPARVRSDLFYALLLKDAGCSANAERMAALFGADDRHLLERVEPGLPLPHDEAEAVLPGLLAAAWREPAPGHPFRALRARLGLRARRPLGPVDGVRGAQPQPVLSVSASSPDSRAQCAQQKMRSPAWTPWPMIRQPQWSQVGASTWIAHSNESNVPDPRPGMSTVKAAS
jgi:hypothetical protein